MAAKHDVTVAEIVYTGDDLNDLECIRYCEITACPSDTVSEVVDAACYVCHHDDSRSAVQEFIEWIFAENKGRLTI